MNDEQESEKLIRKAKSTWMATLVSWIFFVALNQLPLPEHFSRPVSILSSFALFILFLVGLVRALSLLRHRNVVKGLKGHIIAGILVNVIPATLFVLLFILAVFSRPLGSNHAVNTAAQTTASPSSGL